MYDNKIRLSQDVLEKAQQIAEEWGLKNARAAVEAVFRRYSDEYLRGRSGTDVFVPPGVRAIGPSGFVSPSDHRSGCEALDELDDLLGM